MEFDLESLIRPSLLPVFNVSRNAKGHVNHNKFIKQQVEDFKR